MELIDGEVILSASPVDNRQRIAVRIAGMLEMKVGGEVFFAPFDVHLDDYNIIEPDLIVEIDSPSTMKRDQIKKFELYEKHGVREYWMVDPEYEQLGLYGKTGSFKSPTLGKTVDLTPVFP